MQKLNKYGMILVAVLVFSLLEASVASAKTEGHTEELASSFVCYGGSLDAQPYFPPSTLVCPRAVTGRWIITYIGGGEDHYVTKCELYVPDFINNEQDAKNWRWSDEYIADNCSLADEPQTWQGIYLSIRKETKPGKCHFLPFLPPET